jgi:hypothetical protein
MIFLNGTTGRGSSYQSPGARPVKGENSGILWPGIQFSMKLLDASNDLL